MNNNNNNVLFIVCTADHYYMKIKDEFQSEIHMCANRIWILKMKFENSILRKHCGTKLVVPRNTTAP